jgi:hypothetical protein
MSTSIDCYRTRTTHFWSTMRFFYFCVSDLRIRSFLCLLSCFGAEFACELCIFRMGPKKVPRCYDPCEQCDKKYIFAIGSTAGTCSTSGDSSTVWIQAIESIKKWCETCYKANLALCELDKIEFIYRCEYVSACSDRITSAISMFAIDSEPHLTESNVKSLYTALSSLQRHLHGGRKCSCQIRPSESCKLFFCYHCLIIICESDCFCFLHRWFFHSAYLFFVGFCL